MSLAKRRILITRTRQQASTLATQLEALGATPILIPTIELAPPESFSALDAALAAIRSYDWLIFTSANAVDAFHRRAQFHHLTAIPRRIAVIGPATARAVEAIGLQVDLIPSRYVAESLAEALLPQTGLSPDAPANMLLVRAEQARDTLPEALTAAGAHLTIADAYRNQVPPDAVPALQHLFASPQNYPDAITFTSASTATNLFALLEAADLTLPPSVALASIGPITSSALRDLGYSPHLEATEATIPALVQALQTHFAK
ncbi:uroporphyrinogen-III synthase [Granulicella sp. dw_53]|uniref:uroporphyrinogen-III synthase n=1 Tax=Granulicella sp. dw_53 TaxID=2719792 RepID=UPI001BD46AE9|nr:uroporphyrinogen-III synthase [Granulicella sp. dw_53]